MFCICVQLHKIPKSNYGSLYVCPVFWAIVGCVILWGTFSLFELFTLNRLIHKKLIKQYHLRYYQDSEFMRASLYFITFNRQYYVWGNEYNNELQQRIKQLSLLQARHAYNRYSYSKYIQYLRRYSNKTKWKLWGFGFAIRQLCQVSPWHTTVGLQLAHWKRSLSIRTGWIFNGANEREQWVRLFHISARATINGGKMKVAQPLVSYRSGMGSD